MAFRFKNAVALLTAAALIFAAAGCANKVEPGQSESSTGEQTSSEESTAEESVTQPSAQSGSSVTERHTKRPTITLYSTRPTSPNRLTSRPTTTQRTTVKIEVPTVSRTTTTRRSTTLKTTVARTTRPNTQAAETTTAPPEPQFSYGGTLSAADANGNTDSVKIVSHTCSYTDRKTFAIVLTVEILEHSSENKTMYIAYNCYDKNGNKINEKTLFTVVPLGEPGDTVRTVATATADTVKVEFTNY